MLIRTEAEISDFRRMAARASRCSYQRPVKVHVARCPNSEMCLLPRPKYAFLEPFWLIFALKAPMSNPEMCLLVRSLKCAYFRVAGVPIGMRTSPDAAV